MADDGSASRTFFGFRWGPDLGPRIVSSVVLLAIALSTLIAGSVWFSTVVGLVYAGAYREWDTMVASRKPGLIGNLVAGLVMLSAIAFPLAGIQGAALLAVFGFAVILVFGGEHRRWRVLGYLIACTIVVSVLSIRGEGIDGIFAGLFLGCTIWLTDTGAYFAGRQIGGAKLSPDISPSKTWSGAIGGLVTGSVCALIVWLFATSSPWWLGLAFGILLSVVGQLGDLAESALKRRFRIKDSSDLIPGHGGLMDRLDSLSFAAVTLALIGMAHASFESVAFGFLVW